MRGRFARFYASARNQTSLMLEDEDSNVLKGIGCADVKPLLKKDTSPASDDDDWDVEPPAKETAPAATPDIDDGWD